MQSARILRDILLAPQRGFATIQAHTPVFAPLTMLMAAGAALGLAFVVVALDPSYLVDESAARVPDGNSEHGEDTADAAQVIGLLRFLVPPAMAAGAAVVLLVFACWLWIAGRIAGDGASFRASLSLASWASLPALVDAAAMLIAFASVGPWHSSLDRFNNPLWLPSMLGLEGSSVEPFLHFTVTDPWIVVLTAIGCRQFYAVSMPTALVIAVCPFVFIGVWTAA